MLIDKLGEMERVHENLSIQEVRLLVPYNVAVISENDIIEATIVLEAKDYTNAEVQQIRRNCTYLIYSYHITNPTLIYKPQKIPAEDTIKTLTLQTPTRHQHTRQMIVPRTRSARRTQQPTNQWTYPKRQRSGVIAHLIKFPKTNIANKIKLEINTLGPLPLSQFIWPHQADQIETTSTPPCTIPKTSSTFPNVQENLGISSRTRSSKSQHTKVQKSAPRIRKCSTTEQSYSRPSKTNKSKVSKFNHLKELFSRTSTTHLISDIDLPSNSVNTIVIRDSPTSTNTQRSSIMSVNSQQSTNSNPVPILPNTTPGPRIPIDRFTAIGTRLKLSQNNINHVLLPSRRPPTEAILDLFGYLITQSTMDRFNDGKWFNDEQMNYYIQGILAVQFPCIRYLTTFFLTAACDIHRDSVNIQYHIKDYVYQRIQGYTTLARHSDRLPIFEYEQIFIPINRDKDHWVVIHITPSQRTIRYYDSCFRSSYQIEKIIRQWLKDESQECNRDPTLINNWEFHPASRTKPTNPGQLGGSDCGPFALMFIHLLSHGTQEDIHLIQQQDIPDVRKLLRAIYINKGIVRGPTQT